jgi:hypothetical protein
MLRTAGAGLTTPAVVGRGLSEGLGRTATEALCELVTYVPDFIPLSAGVNPDVGLDF